MTAPISITSRTTSPARGWCRRGREPGPARERRHLRRCAGRRHGCRAGRRIEATLARRNGLQSRERDGTCAQRSASTLSLPTMQRMLFNLPHAGVSPQGGHDFEPAKSEYRSAGTCRRSSCNHRCCAHLSHSVPAPSRNWLAPLHLLLAGRRTALPDDRWTAAALSWQAETLRHIKPRP